MTINNISIYQEKFCHEVVKGASPPDAYMATHSCAHMSAKQIVKEAMALSKRKVIKKRLGELRDQAARAAVFDAQKVIENWVAIATTDVNEIVQYRRNACRHCHGNGNLYQWVDAEEFAEAVAKSIDAESMMQNLAQSSGVKLDSVGRKKIPVNAGGYGYTPHAAPNPLCPKCFGEGDEQIFVNDTRNLSDNAKKLYGGVKMTNKGVEVKLRDQDEALLNLAKYFKLLSTDDKKDSNNELKIVVSGGLPE